MSDNALAVNDNVNDAIEQTEYDIIEKNIRLADLPKVLEYILREEMSDFMSDSPRSTAEEIAERAGCHVQSVFRAHKDARYLAVKDKIQDIWFQSKADIFYASLVKSAQSGKVGAIKLGLQITGKHVDRVETRNVNVNADIMADMSGNTTEMVDKFLIMLGTRGWSIDQIVDRWRILKQAQAF